MAKVDKINRKVKAFVKQMRALSPDDAVRFRLTIDSDIHRYGWHCSDEGINLKGEELDPAGGVVIIPGG